MTRITFLAPIVAFIVAAALSHDAKAETPAPARGNQEAVAFAGEPFGVACVTVEHSPGKMPDFKTRSIAVHEKNGRALYPAIEPRNKVTWDELKLPENVLDRKRRAMVYFLFTGAEPLDLAIAAGGEAKTRLDPKPKDNRGHSELLNRWWLHYQSNRKQALTEEYPRLVDDYLVAMLARRLRLDGGTLPPPSTWASGDLNEVIGLLVGAESVRAAMQKETMLDTGSSPSRATEPLPEPVAPPKVEFPEPAADVKIEAIAEHVPHECFYIRFGNYANFRWFRHAVDRWGGDLRSVVTYRGLDYGIRQRIEEQLVLRETSLSKVLGPQVIADVALVGHDTFLREGASNGVLFQAQSNMALAAAISEQRRQALANTPAARESHVQIGGRGVSLITTPDNRVRSYYAVDGDFHLVATSHTLVERFFEAGRGARSLGQSREFRSARTRMPVDRHDTAFIYLSDEFFRLLTGPRYRIEMTRRLRSATEMELVEMARLAATNEKLAADSLEPLVSAGFLPNGFAERPDGSRLIVEADGGLRDSLRGGRGTFIPIMDVELDRATPDEVRAYQRFATFYRSQWERMDPVMVGVKRLDDSASKHERLVFDIHITPVAQRHYGMFAGFLGTPRTEALAPVTGDLAALQLRLNAAEQGGALFAGLRDAAVPFTVLEDGAFPVADHRQVQGYFGGDRNNSLLKFLGNEPSFDAEGFAEPEANRTADLWQRRNQTFRVFSLQRQVLVEVLPQLKFIESPRQAQLRLHIGNISESKLSELANAFAYAHARRVSDGNLRFINTLSSQFGVMPEQSREVGQGLLGGQLICPIGGDYKTVPHQSGLSAWTSTVPPIERGAVAPKGFVAPALDWFRGLELEFTLEQNELSVHAEVEIERDDIPAN